MLKKIIKTAIFSGLLALGLYCYALAEPYWIQVKETVITDSDIPVSFSGLRMVFITDIHHSPSFSRERVRRVVEKVNRLEPDLILLGGDYAEGGEDYLRDCFAELGLLKAPLGVYGVLGNHDYFPDPELSWSLMKEHGITGLDNKGSWIYLNGDRIRLGGVGDLWSDAQILDNVTEGVAKNDYVILLSHNPDYLERMSTDKVDLVLSGHTHGGQVTFFGLWAPVHPSSYGQKYISGLIETPRAKILVSRGIGVLDGRPWRFFARPQINVIRLENS